MTDEDKSCTTCEKCDFKFTDLQTPGGAWGECSEPSVGVYDGWTQVRSQTLKIMTAAGYKCFYWEQAIGRETDDKQNDIQPTHPLAPPCNCNKGILVDTKGSRCVSCGARVDI